MGCWHTKIFQKRIFTARLFFYRLREGTSTSRPSLRSVFSPQLPCSLLRKKNEQSFFAVKVRRSMTTPFFSINPPCCGDPCRTTTPLQQVDSLCLCNSGDHEYMIPFDLPMATVLRMYAYATLCSKFSLLKYFRMACLRTKYFNMENYRMLT